MSRSTSRAGRLAVRLLRRPLRYAVGDVRHVDPVPRRAAPPALRRVYDQVEAEFGMLAPPIALHAPAPDLTALVWSLLRRSLLAPGVSGRAEREVVAEAAARADRCPYCVEVHGGVLGQLAAVPGRDALARWATGEDDGDAAPSGRRADELAAVALTFRYLVRMATVFLPPSPLPAGRPPVARRAGRRVVGRVLAGGAPAASGAPPVRGAAGTAALMDRTRLRLDAGLDEPLVALLDGVGRPSGPTDDPVRPVADLAARDRGLARFALLVAGAPWRVDDAVVAAARHGRADADRVLVETAAAAALRVALRPVPAAGGGRL